MRDSRGINVDWTIRFTNNKNGGVTVSTDDAHLCVLMDIRDQLKELNRTLACYRVSRMSDDIHRIDRRLRENGLIIKGGRK